MYKSILIFLLAGFPFVAAAQIYSPFEKFRTGISAQRTRIYETGLDFQRGIFAEYSLWKLTAGIHYFNPFTTDYFFIGSLNFEF
jgi:hypothetical protein